MKGESFTEIAAALQTKGAVWHWEGLCALSPVAALCVTEGSWLEEPSHLLKGVCPVFSPLKVSGQKAAATAPGEVPNVAQHPAVPGPEQASPSRLHSIQRGDAGAEALQEALCH